MTRSVRSVLLAGTCLSLLVVAGCGEGRPDRVPVSGKVLIDDQPLTYGTIRVEPVGLPPAQGEIQPDGSFTLTTFEEGDGCVPGTHPATIIARQGKSATSVEWLAPKKYLDPATSKLTVTIEGATDDLTVNISWDGGRPFIENFQGGDSVDNE